MPKFVTIGYGDQLGYDRTAASIRDAAHEQDARLREAGGIVGTAGAPVQVRNPDASGIQEVDGAYMRSDLPLAGFALLDAASMAEAIEMVAQTPCAVAHGIVEVWPLDDGARD